MHESELSNYLFPNAKPEVQIIIWEFIALEQSNGKRSRSAHAQSEIIM
jgi:hypothetical protein